MLKPSDIRLLATMTQRHSAGAIKLAAALLERQAQVSEKEIKSLLKLDDLAYVHFKAPAVCPGRVALIADGRIVAVERMPRICVSSSWKAIRNATPPLSRPPAPHRDRPARRQADLRRLQRRQGLRGLNPDFALTARTSCG